FRRRSLRSPDCPRQCYAGATSFGSGMSARFKPLPALQAEQALAADPEAHASLSASAGTGKTQVLTARVLLLLLTGARPESILCLTFTKAAAAEMANRIMARLAACVRLKDSELATDLLNLRAAA